MHHNFFFFYNFFPLIAFPSFLVLYKKISSAFYFLFIFFVSFNFPLFCCDFFSLLLMLLTSIILKISNLTSKQNINLLFFSEKQTNINYFLFIIIAFHKTCDNDNDLAANFFFYFLILFFFLLKFIYCQKFSHHRVLCEKFVNKKVTFTFSNSSSNSSNCLCCKIHFLRHGFFFYCFVWLYQLTVT